MKFDNLREPVHAQDSNLADSRFSNVNLAGAVFDNVNLSGATLHDVNLQNLCITAASTQGMTINDVAVHGFVDAACGHPARFTAVMPVLKVADLQSSIDWYTDVVGMRLLWRKPQDGGGESCMLREGTVTLILQQGSRGFAGRVRQLSLIERCLAPRG